MNELSDFVQEDAIRTLFPVLESYPQDMNRRIKCRLWFIGYRQWQ